MSIDIKKWIIGKFNYEKPAITTSRIPTQATEMLLEFRNEPKTYKDFPIEKEQFKAVFSALYRTSRTQLFNKGNEIKVGKIPNTNRIYLNKVKEK